MFKDLIKFTAKVGIFAAIIVYIVIPNVPGMPKPGDFMPKFPRAGEIISKILDPAGAHKKLDSIADTNHIPRPPLEKQAEDFLKHL
jgi:hypothetical protein